MAQGSSRPVRLCESPQAPPSQKPGDQPCSLLSTASPFPPKGLPDGFPAPDHGAASSLLRSPCPVSNSTAARERGRLKRNSGSHPQLKHLLRLLTARACGPRPGLAWPICSPRLPPSAASLGRAMSVPRESFPCHLSLPLPCLEGFPPPYSC